MGRPYNNAVHVAQVPRRIANVEGDELAYLHVLLPNHLTQLAGEASLSEDFVLGIFKREDHKRGKGASVVRNLTKMVYTGPRLRIRNPLLYGQRTV